MTRRSPGYTTGKIRFLPVVFCPLWSVGVFGQFSAAGRLVFLFGVTCGATAQVHGRLVTGAGQPVGFANVLLLRPGDSALVKSRAFGPGQKTHADQGGAGEERERIR